MKSLLEQAKEVRVRKRISESYSLERLELAMAWVRDEVSSLQVFMALHPDFKTTTKQASGNVLYFVASMLKEAVRSGDIEIKQRE